MLFVCNVTGATLLAYRLTEQSKLAAVSVSLLLLWSNVFFSQHIVALSEPLFFFWQLQICLALWRYFNSSQRRWLLLCGLCAGAGALTRYVGVILFPAIAFVVFLWPAQSCRKRLQAALWVVIPALLPPLALFLRNYLRDGQATSTTWAYHPIPGAKIWDGISAAGYFLLPLSVSAPVWLAVLVAMVGLLGFAYIACLRHYLRQTEAVMPSFKLQTFIVLWSLSYLVMLAVSLSLYNADTPLDHRILTPLYFVWVIAGISLARGYVRLSGRQGLWRVVLLWSLLLAGLNLRILTKAVAHYRCDGIGVAVGYTNRAWRSSGIISYLRALPAQTPIYSNAPDAIEFILGRDTKSFPKQIDPGNLQPVADYLQQEQQMKADVAARQGVIVYFDKFKFREAYLANIEEIKQRQNLRLLHLEDDGAIYIAP